MKCRTRRRLGARARHCACRSIRFELRKQLGEAIVASVAKTPSLASLRRVHSTFAASHRGGSGSPLVCLHGFADTWRTWDLVLPELKRHHDVLAPHCPQLDIPLEAAQLIIGFTAVSGSRGS